MYLRRANPELRVLVVDPTGTWMQGWNEQFARAEIESLRSPIVHHPAPDPLELSDYIDGQSLRRSNLPYDLPLAEVFSQFCADLAATSGLEAPLAASTKAITRAGRSVVVETDEHQITAHHVVVAANPHQRVIPDWVWPVLGERAGFVSWGGDVDLRSLVDMVGERVVIVGGGLTAAHLAAGAAARGATVHMVTRRPVETRSFDTDPGWLGPLQLDGFCRIDDPARRLVECRAARGGGTVPGWMRSRLDSHVEDGSLVAHEGCEVTNVELGPTGAAVVTLSDEAVIDADHLWLATGTVARIDALRCLSDLAQDVPIIDGLPVTNEALQLGPHPVHVMGRLATLTMGPAAGNLWGAQRAANRITRHITGVDLEEKYIGAMPSPPPISRSE